MSSYIWSAFKILATTTFRPYKRAAAAIRSVMMLYKPTWMAMQDSRYYHFMHRLVADKVAVLNEIHYVDGRENVMAADYAAAIDMFGTTNKLVQVSTALQQQRELV